MTSVGETAPWQEPVRGGYPDEGLFGLAGIDVLRSLVQAESPRPPIGHLTGMALTEAKLGSAAFSMPATEWLLSPQGVISVGTLAILADGPLGCAVHSALPEATGYVTSELSLRLLRPARAGGTLVARGSLVHGGRSLALSSVQIMDGGGRLLADGSSLCFVRPISGSPPARPEAQTRAPLTGSPDPFERVALGEALGQDVWDRMSGLEVLRGQVNGELPGPPLHFPPVPRVVVQPPRHRRRRRYRHGGRQRARLRDPDHGAGGNGARGNRPEGQLPEARVP